MASPRSSCGVSRRWLHGRHSRVLLVSEAEEHACAVLVSVTRDGLSADGDDLAAEDAEREVHCALTGSGSATSAARSGCSSVNSQWPSPWLTMKTQVLPWTGQA